MRKRNYASPGRRSIITLSTERALFVTPLGYIHRDDFQTRDVEDLADDFFVWNDRKRTARYYRNCAMDEHQTREAIRTCKQLTDKRSASMSC